MEEIATVADLDCDSDMRRRNWLGPYQALRGNRNLSLLFGGQVVSSLGDWLYITALIVLVYQITGSATVAAALTATRLLPYALFLPLSGVLADRFDRRRLMVLSDFGRAICMVALFIAIYRGEVWLTFPLVFMATSLFSLFRPALGATLPSIARGEDELIRANTLMSQIDGLSIVLGPGLAGVLILLGMTRDALVINAVTYGVSSLTLLRMSLPAAAERDRDTELSWLADTLTGFRFLARQRGGLLATVTVTSAAIAVFNGALWTLAVVMSTQTWHFGSQGAGFLTAAIGAGGLVGGFAVSMIGGRLRMPVRYLVPVAASGCLMVLFGLCPPNLSPFICLIAFGVFDVFNQVDSNTIIQTATPANMLGRVFGAFEASLVGTVLVGSLVTGPMIAVVGPRMTAVALGVMTICTLIVCVPVLLRLRDDRDQPAEVVGKGSVSIPDAPRPAAPVIVTG